MITSDHLSTQSGTGAHVQFLSGALRRAGVEVVVAAMPVLTGEDGSPADDVLRYPQIGPRIVWHEQGGDGLAGGRPAPEWTVARQAQLNLGLVAGIDRDQRFDLVHCHGFRPVPAAVALCGIFGAPLVMSKHGSVLGVRLGDGTVVESVGGWSPFSGWSPFILEYVRATDHYGVANAEKVIVVSDAVRRDLLSDVDSAAKVVVIHNGAGLAKCARDCAARPEPGADAVIGLVGRLVPQKGVDVAVEALALLGRENVRLRVAGAGPMLEPLRRRAEELGVGKRVEFAGTLDRDRLHRFLHDSDLIAAPSRWDAFPQSVCEAQAVGKLVVGTAVDGIVEQITDRETGLLCPPGDARALAGAFAWALDHPAEAARIGSAAAAAARGAYSWDAVAARTLEVYGEAVDRFHLSRG
ncbi:Glycosyltransferase involved in cell wall bisynthesis [Lentzea fradiae]|uniref:Glycosyltransferase involved in cell wall bisynthesis n=2 Tax=Lentzea fradiae TaxID=200378 RepID=A0A1G8BDU2_9PSEU|nr:Glycosyltransferase involved in cell wall bisynthesis [Lentzea fradiae]